MMLQGHRCIGEAEASSEARLSYLSRGDIELLTPKLETGSVKLSMVQQQLVSYRSAGIFALRYSYTFR
jgi:hypothetical protein